MLRAPWLNLTFLILYKQSQRHLRPGAVSPTQSTNFGSELSLAGLSNRFPLFVFVLFFFQRGITLENEMFKMFQPWFWGQRPPRKHDSYGRDKTPSGSRENYYNDDNHSLWWAWWLLSMWTTLLTMITDDITTLSLMTTVKKVLKKPWNSLFAWKLFVKESGLKKKMPLKAKSTYL